MILFCCSKLLACCVGDLLMFIGVVQGAHGDRHFPLYPPPDMLHHMGHPPEFLVPAAAVHFHPPMMPMPPHIIPGPGMPPVPHPQIGAPFHPVPMIPFHEPWVKIVNDIYNVYTSLLYRGCHHLVPAMYHHSENIMKEWQLRQGNMLVVFGVLIS